MVPKSPQNGCDNAPPEWVRPNCVYVQEKYLDDTIPGPKQNLYLGSFTYSQSIQGGPLCDPTYYAFRYVRMSDGGYSKMSPWMTIPVQSGANNLPCYPTDPLNVDQCKAVGITTGSQSCSFNRPEIVTVDDLDLSMKEGYVLNLHRQIGKLNPDSEGDTVGFLIAPDKKKSKGQLFSSHWPDIIFPTTNNGIYCRGC